MLGRDNVVDDLAHGGAGLLRVSVRAEDSSSGAYVPSKAEVLCASCRSVGRRSNAGLGSWRASASSAGEGGPRVGYWR